MKTPKQKAEELVARYRQDEIIIYVPYAGANPQYTSLNEDEAVKCALIACDEIIANLLSLFDKGLKDVHISFDSPKQTHRDVIYPEVEYWQEVKNELNKM